MFLKEEKKEVSYEALKKFSFFESGEWWVKVHVPIEGVGELKKEKIEVEFKERSFDLRI